MNSYVRMLKMWSVLLLAICSSLNGDFRPSDCKIICPKNEEYAAVTKTCNTCDHLLGNVPCNDDECADPGCQCKSGLYRNNKGKCVTKQQCFETSEPEFCGCDKGEVYLRCGCERNCQNKFVPKSCAYECVSGCFCKKSLVRDATGKCVKLESCIAGNGQSIEESSSWSAEYDEDDEERNKSSRRSSQWSSVYGRGRGQSSKKSSEYDEDDEERNQSSRRFSQWLSKHGRGKGQFPKKSSSWSEEQDEDDEERNKSSRKSSKWSSVHGRGRNGQFSKKSSSRSSEYDEDDEDRDQSSRRSSHWSSVHGRGNGQPSKKSSSWSSEYDEDDEESNQSSRKSSHWSSRHEKDSFEETDDSSTWPSDKGKKCGKNEIIVACAKPKWCNTCEIKGNCKLRADSCKKGCDCKEGYYRDSAGICIHESKCSIGAPPVPCALPLCDEPGCRLNYETKPCPSCECKEKPPVSCSIPKCVGPGCKIDYKTKPCPSCKCNNIGNSPGTCGRNEVYKECGSACPATCSNFGKVVACTKQCVQGCFCRDGFVRNSKNKCVKPETCPKVGVPPVTCALPLCEEPGCRLNYNTKPCPSCECKGKPPVHCSIPYCPVDCEINYKTKPCPSCKCKNTGNSPGTCGRNEVYKECGSACPATCSNLGKIEVCTDQCVQGCFCRDGLVRNRKNKCVKPETCPKGVPPVVCDPPKCDKPGCRLNYETKPCPSCECKEKPPVSCSIPKCDGPGCKIDYKTKPCPSCKCKNIEKCPRNEQYSDCVIPCNDCQIKGKCAFLVCNKGCDCIKGHYRDDSGRCIPERLCPPNTPPTEICGKNEEYYNCKPTCKNTCENYSAKVPLCPRICNKGCACKKGLVKRKDGKCVKPNQCDIIPAPPIEICGKNEEYYNCKPTCKNTCENYNAKNPICPLICIKGCACRKGLVKRKDGKCVKPDECDNTPGNPPGTCGRNEVYKECGSACPATCSNLGQVVACTKQCVQGCFCHDGLVRNSKNKCVKPETCPKEKCPRNEQYSDCAIPCNDCQTKGKCAFLVCNKGCDCIKGHYRDHSGRCIPELLCPPNTEPPPLCAPDEQYYECIPSCSRTCERVLSKIKIYCSQLCRPGCFCREGLVKNKDGKCVIPQECTSVTVPTDNCGKDEVYNECGSACPPTCSNLGKNQVCTLQCVQGCFCQKGLVRNDRGECVLPDQCPKSLPIYECKKGESYYDCIPTCKNTCENYKAVNPICPRICIKGCACRAGLVKRKDGKCVTPENCDNTPVTPPNSCGKNEVYNECSSACPPTCSNLGKIEACTLQCVPGCFCQEGLVRNDLNECVKPEMCLTVPPIHECGVNEEYYNCVPTCKDTCETYKQKNAICPLYCKRGCGCKKGFIRRKDGKCVRPDQCDKTPANCGLKEKYYDCMPSCTNVCNPPDACAAVCRPGCFCREGLVLREDGHCVKKEFCGQHGHPSCGINEQYYDCIPDCGNTCKSYGRTDIACTAICRPGCFCKPGLVLNDENKCVLPEFCPRPVKECKNPDQQYYDCTPDCTNTCDNYGKTVACPKICKPGCFCKHGLVLNNENVCVKPKECPNSGYCKDKTMQYYECTPSCKNNCKNYFNPGIRCGCGPPGCFCKQGLVQRESDGRCVLPEQCKKTGHGHTTISETSSSTQISGFSDQNSASSTSLQSSSSQSGSQTSQTSGQSISESSGFQKGSQSSQTSGQSISESTGYQTGSQSSQASGQSLSESSGYERGIQSSQISGQSISESTRNERGSQSSQTTGQAISESSGYQIGSQSSQTSGQSISESTRNERGSQISETSGQSISESSGYQSGSQISQTSGQSISESSGYQTGSQISQTSGQSISESSGYQTGSQISQTSGQSISESSGYQAGSQISETSGQSISESSGLQTGSQNSQTSVKSISESSAYENGGINQNSQSLIQSSVYQDENLSQNSQASSQSSSLTATNQEGSVSQSSQALSQSSSLTSAQQDGIYNQNSQASSQASSLSSTQQDRSVNQNSQSLSQSSSLIAEQQEGIYNQNSQSSSQLSSLSSVNQDSSNFQNAQSNAGSSSSSFVSQDGTASQTSQLVADSSSSSSSSSSTLIGSSSQTSQSASDAASSLSSSSSAYQSENLNQNEQSQSGFSSYSSAFEEANSRRKKSSASSWSSANENQNEFAESRYSSSSPGSDSQNSQSSSASSGNSESSSDSESSNQVSSWFSTIKDEADSTNEQSESSYSSQSTEFQKGEAFQNGQSTSQSSSFSKEYTDGNKAVNGDSNGGFSAWSTGYQEENGVRTAEWDDSTSSWSSGSKNEAGM